MKILKVITTISIASGLLLAACGGTQPPTSVPPTSVPTSTSMPPTKTPAPTVSINNTGWTLATLNGQPSVPSVVVTLNFADGKLNGTDGCNFYNSTYSLNGSAMSVNKNIASTLMACDDAIMKQAQAYTSALAQTATYKADGKTLSLVDAAGKVLATFAAQSKDLAGTSWVVTGYNNGKEAVVSILADTKLTLAFGADGKMNGSAGCNTYTGGYESSSTANTVKFGAIAATKKACINPAGVMTQESLYLKALSNAATYTLDAGRLVIRDASGAMVATFQQAQ